MKEKFIEAIKEELFSQKFCCYACLGEKINDDKKFLCDDCYNKLEIISHCCKKCGDKVGEFDSYCNNCKDNQKIFDKVVCFAKLNDTSKSLIYRLKYGKKKYVASAIAYFLVKKFNESFIQEENADKIDYIVSVPITRNKLKERGFCHTDEIAKDFASKIGIDILENLIIRVKDNLEQTKLNREMRRKNLLNAYVIQDNANLEGKNILIIDDVYTTGATMDAIAQLLKNKGANKVFGLAFCHS